MKSQKFTLRATVSSDQPESVLPVLVEMMGKESVNSKDGDFIVATVMEGTDPRELNRNLLSAIRKAEKKSRLRAEWQDEDGTVYRFFDHVLKKVIEK